MCRRKRRWIMSSDTLQGMTFLLGIISHLSTSKLSSHCRKWQRDPKLAGGVPQWGFSKSYLLTYLSALLTVYHAGLTSMLPLVRPSYHLRLAPALSVADSAHSFFPTPMPWCFRRESTDNSVRIPTQPTCCSTFLH